MNDEQLDLRLWIDSDDFRGWSKKGLRFPMFDENYEDVFSGVKGLIGKVEKRFEAYKNLLDVTGILDGWYED